MSDKASNTASGNGKRRPISDYITVLTVDDDTDFQNSLSFTLRSMKILGKRINHIRAFNYAEASNILSGPDEIDIAFFDVVMDSDDAGLRLIKVAREMLGNQELRIILLTGQPGIAPMQSLMTTYDINDYWTKTELTADRLKSILIGNYRTLLQIREISRAKRGLQLIVASSDAIFASSNYREFSARVLTEISHMLGDTCTDIIIVRKDPSTEQLIIVSATGNFAKHIDQAIETLEYPQLIEAFHTSYKEKKSYTGTGFAILYFPDEISGASHAAFIWMDRELDSTEKELLRVFSVNVASGLQNVSLVSRLDRLAYEDEQLHIPNRNTLLRILDQIINRDGSDRFAFVLSDINGFSGINTTLGSPYGDRLLTFVAGTLRNMFPPNVTVCRVRDDLFGIIGPKECTTASAIHGEFNSPDRNDDYIPNLSISTITYPLEFARETAMETLTCAYRELKASKKCGISQDIIYNPESDTKTILRFNQLQLLKDAIRKNQIDIALQPQIDIAAKKICGFEALARWRRENGTIISPSEFIPLAEATGLIVPMGWQILTHSCAAIIAIKEAGFSDTRVAVNFSSVQFDQPNLITELENALKKNGVGPESLEIEATESVAMGNFENLRQLLLDIKNMGFHLSIDDFGTGFSSLSYLTSFPAQKLKIDKSFIDHIPGDQSSNAIARTVINLAKNVNMRTIAEGVETREQYEWLADQGCDEIQGYYFARPMPVPDTLEWLKKHPNGVMHEA